jgi:hypothetical protein
MARADFSMRSINFRFDPSGHSNDPFSNSFTSEKIARENKSNAARYGDEHNTARRYQ